jgi:leucine dehydrogenase
VNPATNQGFDQHEHVAVISDEATGLAGFVAVHSTRLGPAAGGCRMASYVSPEAALTDALRLSQGMSYKNALAELPAGGGKAVLYRTRTGADREAVFEAFGAAVEALKGAYITAEDVGASVGDMEAVSRRTRYVAGLPPRGARAGGDPSPWTALGVFVAIETCIERPLQGARIAVQGLGSVGFKLCGRLHAAGARLVVADVDKRRTQQAQDAFGAEIVPVDRIHLIDADVFSPNALGAGLNENTISELGAPVVCGGANNQLSTPQDGRRLLSRGVTYAPDYVVNAGGIINVMAEYLGEAESSVESRVRAIGPRTRGLLDQALDERLPPHEVADRLARARIGRLATASVA